MNRRLHRFSLLACLVCTLIACAAARRRALLDLSEARLSRALELHAEALAPAAFQQFRKAQKAAQKAAVDSPERADRTTEARLWLETAISVAEQTTLAKERLNVERDNVRLDEAFLADERERLLLEDESEHSEAAAIATLEAERALARAALAPGQRTKLSSAEVERAALSLLERAELIALALPLGAVSEAAREQLAKLLQEARSQLRKTPDRALTLADQALFQAFSLLGPLRTGKGAPSDAQKASLAEALELLGARVVRDERGLTASLPEGLGPNPAARRGVGRLCAMTQSYPEGPVQVAIDHGSPERKVALQKLLTEQGCIGERFSVAEVSRPGTGLLFTWLAY